jgi:hypothetical protein
MRHRKSRPRWPLLTAALISLPVLYVVSLGPLTWMEARHKLPDDSTLLQMYFWPWSNLERYGPEWMATPVQRYMMSWRPWRGGSGGMQYRVRSP